MANWTGNTYVDSLIYGWKWNTTTLTYAFDNTGTGGVWSAAEKAAFQNALASWSAVANVQFTQISNPAIANLSEKLMVEADSDGALGWHEAYTDYGSAVIQTHGGQLHGSFNTQGTGWDDNTTGGLRVGGTGYVTLVHEIGHALGLDHTHSDDSADPHSFPGITGAFNSGSNALNQDVFSVMSYVDGITSKPVSGAANANNYGYVGGPMAFDIAAIQMLYGANMNAHAGNDTYVLPTSNAAGTFFSALWDAGGIDSIVHNGSVGAVIDLRPATLTNSAGGGGYLSQVGGVYGGFTIAADFTNVLANANDTTGVVIENASGGSGADTITGNGAGNSLSGNAGNDTISGLAGDDVIDGGLGADQANGGDGNDTFRASLSDGNDTLTGGNGVDILDFTAVSGAVQVNQFAGLVTGSAGNDTMLDVFEQIIGSAHADVLSGSNAANVLDGGAGDDKLYGNGGNDLLRGGEGGDSVYFSISDGNDTLTGGNGFDTLDYSSLGGAVSINQLAGFTNGTAGNDKLDDIFEMVIGSNYNDILSGGHGGNGLKGGAGADQLFGNNGDDYTSGGDGNDTVTMGIGNDTHDFRNGEDVDTITDFTAGGTADHIQLRFYSGMTSYQQLVDQGRLQTVNGHAEVALDGGDRIILSNIASHTLLTADDFIF